MQVVRAPAGSTLHPSEQEKMVCALLCEKLGPAACLVEQFIPNSGWCGLSMEKPTRVSQTSWVREDVLLLRIVYRRFESMQTVII